ncbi:MAG: AI-2E family transporter [Nanoarchaeota archaeon]|nr:AI-2E family transporter [Nanoarchaeota archaeon]
MFDEKFRKIFALVLLITSGLFLLYMLLPYFAPIILAVVLAYLMYPFYLKIQQKIGGETLPAAITLISIFLLVIIPLALVAGVVYNQVSDIRIGLENVADIEDWLNDSFGIEVSLTDTFGFLRDSFIENLQNYSQIFVSITTTFLVSLFIFFFVLFYALTQKESALKTAYTFIPFSLKRSEKLVSQSGFAIKALLIGQVLTAIIQGLLATISFVIAGVHGAFFWGIVTIILSLIPVVGAFMVWLPIGIYLIINGNVGMGIFVLLWGALLVSQIDNFIRPKLVNRYFKLHPLFVLVGVFAGISLFGMLGLVLGPLLFAFFILFLEAYREEYGDKKNMKQI